MASRSESANSDAISSDHGRDILKKRLFKGGIASIAGRGLGIAAQFCFTFLLARILSPQDFGLWCWMVTFLSFSGVLMLFGAEETIVRQTASGVAAGNRSQLKIVVLLSIVVVSAISFLSLPFFRTEFSGPESWLLRLGFVCIVVLHVAHRLIGAALRGKHILFRANLFTGRFGGPLAGCGFVLMLIPAWFLRPLSLSTIVAFNAIGFLLFLPLGLIWIREAFAEASERSHGAQKKISFAAILATFLACMPAMFAELFGTISQSGDVWLLGIFATADDLAQYLAARRLMSLVTTPFTLAGLTIMSSIPELHAQGKLKDLQWALQTSATTCLIPAIAVLVPIMLFPEQLLSITLGKAFAGGAVFLTIFACGQILRTFSGHCVIALVLTGNARIAMIINGCSAILILCVSAYAAAFWGPIAVAVSWSTLSVLQSICSLWALRATVGVWSFATPSAAISTLTRKRWLR